MKETIVMQECGQCGKIFPIKYFEDGSIEYTSDSCDCEAEFSPIEGQPSISEWLKRGNRKEKYEYANRRNDN